ncbi:MAG: hypothetical protein P1Q69_21030, partial [Candidatus Thorarchaeota archaeon]|nr:hypothetical protein [Candidatus Thorarchaeota archaeon]
VCVLWPMALGPSVGKDRSALSLLSTSIFPPLFLHPRAIVSGILVGCRVSTNTASLGETGAILRSGPFFMSGDIINEKNRN